MYLSGVRYILTDNKGKVVSDSGSDQMYNMKISQKEKVKRLHLADDLFYTVGEIKEIIIKLKNGEKLIIPAMEE